MSDLAATGCGCGCNEGNNCCSLIWIILKASRATMDLEDVAMDAATTAVSGLFYCCSSVEKLW